MDGESEARLRQFEILWAEIARRSNAQQALMAASITATGTVGGLVVAEGAGVTLLLVLAMVTPVVGLLWLDHARNIGEIGEFIEANWSWSPNWEARHARLKLSKDGRRRFWVFVAAVSIVFLFPAAVGLGASLCHLGDWLAKIAWFGGLVATLLFAVSWLHQVAKTRPRHSGRTSP